jgi:Leucine-rich repeat (LRR) protein
VRWLLIAADTQQRSDVAAREPRPPDRAYRTEPGELALVHVALHPLTIVQSNNKLDNSILDIIFKITSLKDLKLAKNDLEGELSSLVSNLTALETLELQENKLTTLPSSLGDCGGLHVINVAHNSLEVFPAKEISRCALRELDVSENKLSGALFPECIEHWDSLQSLNVKGNHLTSFAESSVTLPALHSLIVSNNQLAAFPCVTGWNELLVLLVDGNRIERLPEELFTLVRLRTLDFSRNHVKIIDPRLGGVESLELVNSSGNPLLDRKLAGMSATDLKRTLRGRLAPPEIVIAEAEDDDNEPVLFPGMELEEGAAPPKGLEVGRAGLLDLSRKGYEQLSSELMDSIIGSPVTMILSHNSLSAIPPTLDRFASLCTVDLSFNKLSGEYLPEKLQLRSLQTLNLHNTSLTSLDVLFKNLDASKLQTLDISANRITSIVGLRETFPGLINLHAADNQIAEVPLPSVDGIRMLDLSGNAIASLPPKLALCSNLRELRVQGNLFRVPRWQVLEKGTEAVLQWLRERLPPEETEEVGEVH